MARPTKFTKETEELAEEYLKQYKDIGDMVPSVTGLCVFLGIGKTTIYRWLEDKDNKKIEKFRDTLEQIKLKQRQDLVNGGLSSKLNSTITKLMLSHNHGIKETSTTELVGNESGPIQTENKWIVEFIGVEDK